MNRRKFLAAVGGAAGAGLAGCVSQPGSPSSGNDDDGTLTIATYDSFVEDQSSLDAPATWLKEQFESEHEDVTIEWVNPDNGLNHYVQRHGQGIDLDADAYLGVNVDDLIRADERLDDSLFQELDWGSVGNTDAIKSELEFDPDGRVMPYDTGYISLVYDEGAVDEPATFDRLTEPAYEGALLAQNAQQSDPGRAFLLWTIDQFGEDGYLDYWRALQDNDVQILGSWWDSYSAYSEGERPMVVSYSTDQVYANRADQDMSRHQLGFLEDQGYANPEGMGVFAGSEKTELAQDFFEFVLSPDAQGQIATLNVQFPATTDADLNEEFDQYAHEPPETVFYDYEDLQGNLDGWVEDWAREIAG
ncbi:thiamine transport system substrate-binding protein [Natronoarchaeum philippinense]|uniref:Thiamine transport system substrate-binding protein n=1 Tax=Natronoarchaeum philippinense TaxID=558529 RepID=A0A285P0A4_NATPI|nr:thiamine ABC transporter substrate-binding protein [Natronoarchaeum philippinense]SNZ15155.1 thiamine transport system substrate-binding protein [Natronoarchaeum philippinense]